MTLLEALRAVTENIKTWAESKFVAKDDAGSNLPTGDVTALLESAKSYTDSQLDEMVGDITVAEQISSAVSSKQDIITGSATTITDTDLTANRALITNGSGKVAVSNATSTELGYLTGVTSNIQTQLNSKAKAYTYGTTDLTDGVSTLETGKLYFVYE